MATEPDTLFEIYALCDPSTGAIRYVGKANNSRKRFAQHLRDCRRRNSPVHVWLRKLAASGLTPSLRILALTFDWRKSERELIAVLRARGEALLNVAEGGDQPYCSPEQRAINGRKLAAAIHSDPVRRRVWEIKRAVSSALREGYISNASRAKLRTAALKRPDLFAAFATIPDRVE
jgi:hypothetical protein